MTIVEFIEARLAEDERRAKAAADSAWTWPWRYEAASDAEAGRGRVVNALGEPVTGAPHGPGAVTEPCGQHIARHDPATVLRQCAAWRTILDQLVGLATDYQDSWPEVLENGGRYLPEQGHYDVHPTLRRVAAIWSEHPDFRPEWRAPDQQ